MLNRIKLLLFLYLFVLNSPEFVSSEHKTSEKELKENVSVQEQKEETSATVDEENESQQVAPPDKSTEINNAKGASISVSLETALNTIGYITPFLPPQVSMVVTGLKGYSTVCKSEHIVLKQI